MTPPPETVPLFGPLFTTDRIRDIFSARHTLERMLDFESALGRALAALQLAPASAARSIESQCNANLFDIDALARDAAMAGNVAIPMVKALTSLVAKVDEGAASFVHWGATSQDAIDTGLVLQLREALEVLEQDLAGLSAVLKKLAETHVSTILAGRTWLQQGPPTTLGLKIAGWFSAIERHRARIAGTRTRVCVIQFGGAVGTLAALGDRGLDVARALATELKLSLPALPWHAHRDRLAEVATVLGLLTGSLGKIARDVSLMAQTEVDEALEPAAVGRGGSSTMPHKRNPVSCAVVLAAAMRIPPLVSTMLSAMVQEHERGLGGWHAEWETLPEICALAAGAVAHSRQMLDGLEVHANEMARNLDVTHGLILAEAVVFALARHVGKKSAQDAVELACRRARENHRPLKDVLLEMPEVQAHLPAEEITRLLDPANYLGFARQMTQMALSASDPFAVQHHDRQDHDTHDKNNPRTES